MYEYIKGKIIEIEDNYIVLENNNIGYIIYVANPYSYKKEDSIVYVYHYVKEDEMCLYGFKTKEERDKLYTWIEKLEFELLELPIADIRVFLHTQASVLPQPFQLFSSARRWVWATV